MWCSLRISVGRASARAGSSGASPHQTVPPPLLEPICCHRHSRRRHPAREWAKASSAKVAPARWRSIGPRCPDVSPRRPRSRADPRPDRKVPWSEFSGRCAQRSDSDERVSSRQRERIAGRRSRAIRDTGRVVPVASCCTTGRVHESDFDSGASTSPRGVNAGKRSFQRIAASRSNKVVTAASIRLPGHNGKKWFNRTSSDAPQSAAVA